MIQVELYLDCDQPGCSEGLGYSAQDATAAAAEARAVTVATGYGWHVGQRRV